MDGDQPDGSSDGNSLPFSSWPAVEFLFDDEPGGEDEEVSRRLRLNSAPVGRPPASLSSPILARAVCH